MDLRNKKWLMILSAFISILIFSIPIYVFGVFIEPLTNEFGWSKSSISSVYSVFMIGYLLGVIFTGKKSDEVGAAKVMGIGSVVVGACLLVSGQLKCIFHFYLVFFAMGLGSSALYVPPTSTIVRNFAEKRGLAIGISATGFGVGMAFFSPLTERMILMMGWRSTFVLLGILSLVLLTISSFIMNIFTKNGSDIHPKEEKRRKYSFQIREIFRKKSFRNIYFFLLVSQLSSYTVIVFLVPYAIEIGISTFYASFALTIFGVCNIFGRVLGGFASDKFSVTQSIKLFLSLHMVSVIFLSFSQGIWSIYILAGIFGMAYGGWVMSYPVLVGDFFEVSGSGMALGLIETASGIAGATGPFFAGYLFDLTESYQFAFLTAGMMITLSIILAIRLHSLKFSSKP